MPEAINNLLNNETKYIYVEMVLNEETKYEVVSGLFEGIVTKDGEVYVVLHGVKDTTLILNTKYYNIMSIEALEKDYKNMVYLTAETKDQDIGLQMLTELKNMFIDLGFSNDSEGDINLIDIDKYSEVPEEYKEGTVSSSNNVNNKPIVGNSNTGFGSHQATHYGGCGYDGFANKFPPVVQKKEPKPTRFFRDKDKKPTKKALETMFEKVKGITDGSYKYTLPKIDHDEGDEKDIDDTDLLNEDYYLSLV